MIGGEEKVVDEVVLFLKEKGIKRMILLNVSGFFYIVILVLVLKKLVKDLSYI